MTKWLVRNQGQLLWGVFVFVATMSSCLALTAIPRSIIHMYVQSEFVGVVKVVALASVHEIDLRAKKKATVRVLESWSDKRSGAGDQFEILVDTGEARDISGRLREHEAIVLFASRGCRSNRLRIAFLGRGRIPIVEEQGKRVVNLRQGLHVPGIGVNEKEGSRVVSLEFMRRVILDAKKVVDEWDGSDILANGKGT